jgi:hypothetical protein
MVFSIFISERNLNPKAACLKRREEEKAEDNVGPKLGHHLSVAQHMVVQGPHFPPMTLVSLFLIQTSYSIIKIAII